MPLDLDHTQTLTTQELRDIFAAHGLRTTRQRESVYQVLCACRTHPTADDLMVALRAIDPEISQATIYNTLDAFVECGLATRIPSPASGGACRFDPNTSEHVHLVLDDGRMMDIPMDLSQQIIDAIPAQTLKELAKRTGIELKGVKIEIHGTPQAATDEGSA